MASCLKVAAEILDCDESQLRDRLNHPDYRRQLNREFAFKKFRTTYEDRNGFRKTILFGGFTQEGAHLLKAYGRLSRPFNVPVSAHYYSRHRLRLRFPYLPCIIEKFGLGAEDR
jgi:hypothetical protein